MTTQVTGIRFVATYQRFGDGEAKDWFGPVMDFAIKNEDIWAHNLLTVERGIWGIEFLVFTVDVLMTDDWRIKGYDESKEQAKGLLDAIVGDSDVEVLWASAIESEVAS